MNVTIRFQLFVVTCTLLTIILVGLQSAAAQPVSTPSAPVTPLTTPPGLMLPPSDYVYSPLINLHAKYDAWLNMVHRTHEEEQPDWMTPLVTVIPTLQQELRTDYDFAFAPHGEQTFIYASKGTEIIPTENTEFIFGNPSYVTKNVPAAKHTSGWADWPFLFKYRLLSSPSDAGNYVLTFMLSTTFATGSTRFVSANHDIFSPLIGFGKGIETKYGEFDYQATIGPSVPDGQTGKLGTPVIWNSTFQYGNRFHLGEWTVPLWPEFETTWIAYPNGENRGQQQLYLTPGLIAGRCKLTEHTYFVLGAGLQFAATQARTFNRQWLVTMRIPYF
jgi:hypothetical protein